MENFIIYLVKASGLLALFFLAYYFLLRKETFFTPNRWFLLSGLFTSALLPLIEYTKIIWIAPVAAIQQPVGQTIDFNQLMLMQQVLANQPKETININWFDVVAGMYFAGVLLFLIRFIFDSISIRKILKSAVAVKDKRFRLIDSYKVDSPFSFFNYIVYNSSVLEPDELNSIINHEKVHSAQKHSLDMIISQLFCIAFWFNPFAWMYKKSISQNLEFIADAGAIKLLEDKKAYQKTLLKITVQPDCITITNHFYQSLIKKRIVMLNKKQSNRLNSWKYAMILPALTAFMFLFQVKVVAQEKAVTVTNNEKTKLVLEITKDTKDSELDEQATFFKDEFDADAIISDLQRNGSGEITGIKVTVKDKDQSRVYQASGNKPIAPFTIALEKSNGSDENNITFTGTNMRVGSGNYTTAGTAPLPPHPPVALPARIASIAPLAPRALSADTITYYRGNPQINFVDKGALVIINGVQQKERGDIKIPEGQEISLINVLSEKDAKNKYGREAKKGAVEITTRKGFGRGPVMPRPAYSYTYSDNGDMVNLPPMPDMDVIMGYALSGVDMGMDALANIDWQKTMDFEGLSEEERREIQEEMKQARIEVQEAMNEADVQRAFHYAARDDYKKAASKGMKAKIKNAKDKKEIDQAKIELQQARKELEKTKKELEKAKKELKKKSK